MLLLAARVAQFEGLLSPPSERGRSPLPLRNLLDLLADEAPPLPAAQGGVVSSMVVGSLVADFSHNHPESHVIGPVSATLTLV